MPPAFFFGPISSGVTGTMKFYVEIRIDVWKLTVKSAGIYYYAQLNTKFQPMLLIRYLPCWIFLAFYSPVMVDAALKPLALFTLSYSQIQPRIVLVCLLVPSIQIFNKITPNVQI